MYFFRICRITTRSPTFDRKVDGWVQPNSVGEKAKLGVSEKYIRIYFHRIILPCSVKCPYKYNKMANLSPFLLTRMRFFFGESCHHFLSLFYSYSIFINTLYSHSFRPRAYRAISSHIRRRWNDEGIWIVIPIHGICRR